MFLFIFKKKLFPFSLLGKKLCKASYLYSYISDPVVVKVQENGTANFIIIRNGSDADVVYVLYATVNGGASAEEEDYLFSEKSGVLFFDIGIREQNITVFISDDDIPESDETFYIILFNSTGSNIYLIYSN